MEWKENRWVIFPLGNNLSKMEEIIRSIKRTTEVVLLNLNQWNNVTYANVWVRFLINTTIKNIKPLGDRWCHIYINDRVLLVFFL